MRKGIAAVLISLVVPGGGQVYNGQVRRGLVPFAAVMAGLTLCTIGAWRSFWGLAAFLLIAITTQVSAAVDAFLEARRRASQNQSSGMGAWARFTIILFAAAALVEAQGLVRARVTERAFIVTAESGAPTLLPRRAHYR